MKTKVYYLADDGAELESRAAVKRHNTLLAKIRLAMAPLGSKVKDRGCRFANGGGYRQHKQVDVLKAKAALIAIAKTEVPDKIWEHPPEEIHPMSFAARLLDDASSTLYRAWHRFMCIDERTGREWGQPYYALNPEEGEQKEWRS